MVTRTIGQYWEIIELEKDKEDWGCYIEKIILYFEVNEIEEDSKKTAILLSSVWQRRTKL